MQFLCNLNVNITSMNKLNFRRGFTLVEILVVIGIIGVLSAVLYANFGDARQEAKNKAMRSELKETQLALELYKAQNGNYPPAFDISSTGCSDYDGVNDVSTSKSIACGANPVINGLTPEFIANIPSSAKSANPACEIWYQVSDDDDGTWDADDGGSYKLTADNCHAGATTQADGVQSDDKFARCPSSCGTSGSCNPTASDFYNSYSVYSNGGECY